ncbi:hypothetical protein Ptr902_12557 [Pyrenophora tritici-repentis]|nr:hypothetical protein Ptr902_12557 [Pyrenophora tritici-repentis]
MVASIRSDAAMPAQPKEPHISQQPFTWKNWYRHIDWLNTTLVVLIPIYGLCLARNTTLTRPTLLWTILYYGMTALVSQADIIDYGAIGATLPRFLYGYSWHSWELERSKARFDGGALNTALTIDGRIQ